MKKRLGKTETAAVAVLLFFCAAMAFFTVIRGQLDFRLEDTARSLETSRGRERKQQAEYDEVAEALPRTREELETVRPLAQEASENVSRLKAERKQLREEKKRLEAGAGGTGE